MTCPTVSFEFFPPKNIPASFRLHETVRLLAPLAPEFVSVTYGAGGTTRQLTREAALAIHKSANLRVAAHLTCVEATRDETLTIAREYKAAGISDIVALRGDPPKGSAEFTAHPEGFASSLELISALKAEGDFTIRVAAYPDTHPDAPDVASGIDFLKAKFDAGADEAITQFFFEPDRFLRFRDACVAAGITQPILPGILPIENWAKMRSFAKTCGTPVPGWLNDAFEKAERDDRCELLSTAIATEMCSALIEEGVEHLHFYTLNKPELTRDICTALGRTIQLELAEVA